jgi:hypothetical protein
MAIGASAEQEIPKLQKQALLAAFDKQLVYKAMKVTLNIPKNIFVLTLSEQTINMILQLCNL